MPDNGICGYKPVFMAEKHFLHFLCFAEEFEFSSMLKFLSLASVLGKVCFSYHLCFEKLNTGHLFWPLNEQVRIGLHKCSHKQSLNIGITCQSGCLTQCLFWCSVLRILLLKMVRDSYCYVILCVLDEILLKRLLSAIENE